MKVKIPITTNALCVDASCSGNPGVMEYRAVDLKTRKEVFHSPIYPKGTNNLGEFLAIYDAIRYIEKLEKKNKPAEKSSDTQHLMQTKYECIFTDSETALAWIKSKKIKTTLEYTPQTKELLTKVQEAITRIKTHDFVIPIRKRETEIRGEIPADFDRK
jgi:ribonuclease HI